MNHILFFGLGFSAKALAERLAARGWTVSATSRSESGAAAIRARGYRGFVFDGSRPLPQGAFEGVTHAVGSAPPGEDGDPVLRQHAGDFAERAKQFQWVAYLSTTGVYGDHGGGLVTEETPLSPNTERGHKRLLAETQWLGLWRGHGLPVMVFRLAGIYGPGRNQLLPLLDGSARRVIKEGQIFSRIHVADIANTLEASIAHPHPGRAYNVCDDEACPPQDVVEYGARLLGLPAPPDVPFEAAGLSPMARSFYADSKRVSNARIVKELGVRLSFPTYREGLGELAKGLKR
ncbi:SDR family oxidoreductase [Aestuariivirga sp.]|uniref:SDR family oxidoreductase n=1 Tax=Aestuariivirga sp. TaxID=2650926 RepID=UPI0025BBAC35|nr:SDR family oxidoreductase [Aestuariivirga sp.]MCA3554980.1 SDR family oxidoreductase [Aestuariivirga sp.]